MKNYLLPKLRDVLFLSIFVAAITLGPRMLNMDGDLPKHLVIGKYVLQGNFPPTNDIFSFTKYGIPFAPHKWLSGVLFYLAYIVFTEKGIVVLSAIALASTFSLIYSDRAAHTKIRIPVFFIVAFGAAVSSLHWIARPHIFTMLLLSIWLILTEKLTRSDKVRWWYFPAVMFLWNNIHGEYIAGFLVTISYLAGWGWDYMFNRAVAKLEVGKQLGLAIFTSLVVTVLNPVSLRAWSTVTNWIGNDYLMERTQETVPPNFLQPEFYILLLFLGFSVFLLSKNRSGIRTGQAFMLAGFTILVLTSARNVHLYGIIAPFVLASAFTSDQLPAPLAKFEENIASVEKNLRGVAWPFILTIITLMLLIITPLGLRQRFAPSYFPVEAVEWLKSNPQEGEMFNPFDWGGYISFMLWPENKVFIDSQGDVYGEEFIRKYEQVITLQPEWKSILAEYNVSWAIIPTKWQLAQRLLQEDWLEIYRDETTVILKHQ